MKNSPKKDDKNSERIREQQKRENAIKKGNPGSSTPQGGGIGNSSQSAMNQTGAKGLIDLNPRFEPIDPETERSTAEQQKKGKSKVKKSPSKSKKQTDTSEVAKDKTKNADPAHWEGEGEPGYASQSEHQTRQWSEKEE